MSTDGHGKKVAGRPQIRWTALRSEPAPAPCPSVLIGGLRAFTLIEMIGVVALVAILLLATAPVLIKKVDRDVWVKEVSELNTISNALALQALRSNSIPSATTWSSVVTNWLTRASSGTLTNSRGNARRFLYDQGGWLSSVTLPWTQSSAGAGLTGPSSARLVVVSSIGTPLPNTNGAITKANFNTIWNASEGMIPSYFVNLGWQGSADDLVIQRVSLDQMFHHLILTTRDNSANARYSINSRSSPTIVPDTPTGLDSYYLDGTTVSLWDGPTTLTNSFILNRDLSFTYEGGMWQAQLTGGGQDNSPLATNFAYQASLFVLAANVPGSHQGSDTQGLLSAFYSFMYGYTIWANECPHFQYSANPLQQTDYQFLDALGADTGIIDKTAGSTAGGLLK